MLQALYEFDLIAKVQRIAFAAACLSLVGVYSWSSLRVLQGQRAAESLTPEGLQRAVALLPENASYWSRLGRYRFFIEQDIPGSVPAYMEATRLNPHVARYWLDLAGAYAVMGKPEEQGHALQRAIAADPKSPRVAWEAGNFYLIRGEVPAALQCVRVVAEGNPTLRVQALRLFWRTFQDPVLLLDKALPSDAAAYWDLLRVTLEFGQIEAANTIWKAIVKLEQPFPAKESLPWIDALLRSGKSSQARDVWNGLARFDPAFIHYLPTEGNLVVNGGFEEDLLNAGFDWLYEARGVVRLNVDRDVFHFGTRSIRLEFGGRSPSRSAVRQIVPVTPGRNYEFSGSLKADHLQTAVGASLVISDPSSGIVIARSAPIDSTTGWVKRSVAFTGPPSSTVEVGVGRAYETSTLIKGTLWLDDVELALK